MINQSFKKILLMYSYLHERNHDAKAKAIFSSIRKRILAREKTRV